MGTTGALGFKQAVDEGQISLAVAIGWHLGSNHFPPVPQVWVPVAIEAIDAANEDDWDRELHRPEGYDQESLIIVSEVIEGLHLDSFLDIED
jgi:hypothetical protein